MNFKDFKKVDVTKTHTIFKHPSGHTIQVAHDSLTPEQKKQMREIPIQSAKERLREQREATKMAKGGLYENIHAKRERIEAGSGERMRKPGSEGAPTEEAFKQAAKTVKMAEGGVTPYFSEQEKQEMAENPEYAEFLTRVKTKYPEAYEKLDKQAQLQEAFKRIGVGEPKEYIPGKESGLDRQPVPQAPQGPTNLNLDKYLAPAQAPAPEEQAAMPKSAYETELATREQAAMQIGEAQKKEAEEQVTNISNTANLLQKAAANALKEKKRLNGMINDVNQAIADQKIDPNRYMGNMSTLGRISTAIGLMLGGMGAGLAGGQNLAFKSLESAIDRDIEAQKMDLNKKNNLLTAYYKMYGDVQQAELALKSQLLATSQLKAQEIAARSKSAQAAQQSQILLAQLGTAREQYENRLIQMKEDKNLAEGTKEQGRPLPSAQAIASYIQRYPDASEKDKEKTKESYIEYAKGLDAIETLKKFMSDQYELSRLVAFKDPGDRAQLLKSYKTVLAPVSKSVTGETRMSDSEFEKFVDPLISKVYTNPETVQKQINMLIQSKSSEMEGHLTRLSMMGLHFPKPITGQTVPSLQRK